MEKLAFNLHTPFLLLSFFLFFFLFTVQDTGPLTTTNTFIFYLIYYQITLSQGMLDIIRKHVNIIQWLTTCAQH